MHSFGEYVDMKISQLPVIMIMECVRRDCDIVNMSEEKVTLQKRIDNRQ